MEKKKSLPVLSRRQFLWAGAATAASAAVVSLPGCGGVGHLLDPNADQYDLTVRYSERNLGGVRIRTRTYNGSIPGPTMRTAPGRRLIVNVKDQLPPNAPPQSGGGGGTGGGHGHGAIRAGDGETQNPNNPHDFNTTNLHVHGLQVRPHLFQPFGTSDPAADFLTIDPGGRFTYEFQIPADQPSGLYWYHPHWHGSTATQVFNGMAGLIVVEGPIDRVPEIAAARDLHMGIQLIRVDPSVDDPNLWVNEPIAGISGPTGFKGAYTKNFYTINGEAVAWIGPERSAAVNQLAPLTINMRPGEVVRLRILNGTDGSLMPLQLDGHKLHVIGWDGINLLEPEAEDVITMAPGNRCEVLIKAGASGVYALRQNPVIGEQFSDSPGLILANVVVAGAAMDMQLPSSLPAPTREFPLIEPSEVAATHRVEFSKEPSDQLVTGNMFLINGKLYDPDRIDHTVQRGTAEEWTLTAGTDEGHPFHVHVQSFQVVEINGQAVDKPMFRDVVWVPKGGTVKVRMRFKDWVGKSVYHCHILFHEDTGMMQNFMITP
jgi:suppressor of ftsI